jgi:hypothetical protein
VIKSKNWQPFTERCLMDCWDALVLSPIIDLGDGFAS